MRISELVIYPIKSLRGISVQSTMVEKRGLRHDRRWMLVDEEGLFLTQRKLAILSQFDVSLNEQSIVVQYNGASIEVPLLPTGSARQVQVWRSKVRATTVLERVDTWFSDQLQMRCGLVYMPEDSIRNVPSAEARKGDIVGFADANPILVASQASIDDLNQRLPSPIPIRRFRPNIVVEGCAAYEEDEWVGLETVEVALRKTHKCGRCGVTTIDIETGISSDEPLRTLNTYRRFGQNVYFGTYYVPDQLGSISVGDPIASNP